MAQRLRLLEPPMKFAALLPAALFCASLLFIPTSASAQSSPPANGRTVLPFPNLTGRTLTPPRPAGLGGNLPPGHGGPSPRETRGSGPGSSARNELVGLAAVCGPGGVLSAEGAAGNPGRTRARARVCND